MLLIPKCCNRKAHYIGSNWFECPKCKRKMRESDIRDFAEDVKVCGYNIIEIKKMIDYCKMHGFNPKE